MPLPGCCKVTSTFFNFAYMENTTLRLITSEIVEGEENTIVLHGLYFDGYDTKLKFNNEDVLDPSIEMEERISAATPPGCSIPYGKPKLVMTQPSNAPPTSSTCEAHLPLRQHRC
ncbi:MAG: DUF4984 domain-containing protein [Bacteroides stercoris]